MLVLYAREVDEASALPSREVFATYCVPAQQCSKCHDQESRGIIQVLGVIRILFAVLAEVLPCFVVPSAENISSAALPVETDLLEASVWPASLPFEAH